MSTGKQGLMWLSFYVVLMFAADIVNPLFGAGMAASRLLGGMLAMFSAFAVVGLVLYGLWLGAKALWEALK